jgi:hypothetical protein
MSFPPQARGDFLPPAMLQRGQFGPPGSQVQYPANYYGQYPPSPDPYDPSILPPTAYEASPLELSFSHKLMELDAQIQHATTCSQNPESENPFCARWTSACDPFPSLWHFSSIPLPTVRPPIAAPPREAHPAVKEYLPPPPAPEPEPALETHTPPLVENRPPPEAAETSGGGSRKSKRRKANRYNYKGNG